MRTQSSIRGLGELSSSEIYLNPIWIVSMLALAIGIIYMVGMEPMVYAHNAFHDLRHATGFPCH
jgi:cobalt transporter subunit CbtB